MLFSEKFKDDRDITPQKNRGEEPRESSAESLEVSLPQTNQEYAPSETASLPEEPALVTPTLPRIQPDYMPIETIAGDIIDELRACLLFWFSDVLGIFEALINAYPGLRPDLKPLMSQLEERLKEAAQAWFPQQEEASHEEENA